MLQLRAGDFVVAQVVQLLQLLVLLPLPTQTYLDSPCSNTFRQDWVADNASMRFMHAKLFWGQNIRE